MFNIWFRFNSKFSRIFLIVIISLKNKSPGHVLISFLIKKGPFYFILSSPVSLAYVQPSLIIHLIPTSLTRILPSCTDSSSTSRSTTVSAQARSSNPNFFFSSIDPSRFSKIPNFLFVNLLIYISVYYFSIFLVICACFGWFQFAVWFWFCVFIYWNNLMIFWFSTFCSFLRGWFLYLLLNFGFLFIFIICVTRNGDVDSG